MFVFEKDKYPILEAIKRIIFDKMESYILLVVGAPQRGKSMTVSKWARIWAFDMKLDPTYTLQDRWALADAERFLKVHDQKLKRGSITVLDEGGVGIDNQLWYTQVSRAIVHLTKTYGHEGIFSIITDTTGDINKKVKKHIKGLLVIERKTPTYTVGKFYEVQFNEKEDKVYYKFPTMVYKDGSCGKLREVKINKPDHDLIKEYNDFQKPLKIALKGELIRDLQNERENKEKINFDFDSVVKKIMEDPQEFKKEIRGEFVWNKERIMNTFNIGEPRSRRIVDLLKNSNTETVVSV